MSSKDRMAQAAMTKATKAQRAIDGTIEQRVYDLETEISSFQESKADKSIMSSLETKIANFASLFGVAFNEDGTISAESYTSHKHECEDATISDTGDGTGTESTTTKTTTGVK